MIQGSDHLLTPELKELRNNGDSVRQSNPYSGDLLKTFSMARNKLLL